MRHHQSKKNHRTRIFRPTNAFQSLLWRNRVQDCPNSTVWEFDGCGLKWGWMRKHRIRERKKLFIRRINMKRLVKVPAVAAVILTLAMAGVSSARAGGWPVAAGVVGRFAAGTIVRRAVANYPPPPAYYVYPQRVYVAPLCAPAPVIVQPAPVCYATAPVVYPFYDPPIRLGVFTGRPHYFRRW
jgi:hypothetical protein